MAGLVLAGASPTLLKVFVATAMGRIVSNTLGAAQASLLDQLRGHAEQAPGQALVAGGTVRHGGGDEKKVE
jgi:hypothetical protein